MIFLSVHSEYPKVDEQEFEKISVSINLYLFIFSNFQKKLYQQIAHIFHL